MTALQPEIASNEVNSARKAPTATTRPLNLRTATRNGGDKVSTAIGRDGSLLRRLAPTLGMWEEAWGATWVTSLGGARCDVFVPTTGYVAPDGTRQLHVSVSAPHTMSIVLRLPTLIFLDAPCPGALGIFRSAGPALVSEAQYEIDAMGMVSVSLELHDSSDANFNLMQFLGLLRGTFDLRFHDLIAARKAAESPMER
jgi:hypothetical protein